MGMRVQIYTDGSCLKNPGGKGGWAAILIYGEHRKEISGHLPVCTNNEAEILAVIQSLEELKAPCEVDLYTDSQIAISWVSIADGTKSKKAAKKSRVLPWVIERLRPLVSRHRVSMHWVKGHSGVPENERCDQMASEAARIEIPVEDEFESSFLHAISK